MLKHMIIKPQQLKHCSETTKCQSCIESVCVKSLSRVRLFETPWTSARQAPRSMGFPRQEYWTGVPFPSPEDLPNPRIEPRSPVSWADSLPLSHQGSPLSVYLIEKIYPIQV